MKIINLNKILHRELISSKTGEIYSKSAVLTDFFDFHDMFVHHEILQSGRRSALPHYHTLQEDVKCQLALLLATTSFADQKLNFYCLYFYF